MNTTLTLAAAAAGVAGWCVTEFCARPVREFFQLRTEVRRLILTLQHMPAAAAAVRLATAGADERKFVVRGVESAFCDLGTKLVAFGETEIIAAWAMEWLGFDTIKAGRLLITLSATREGPERDAYLASIEQTLRLTRSGPAAREQRLAETRLVAEQHRT